MKILHIVGDSKYGGGTLIILELAKLARDLGWEVQVLTTDPVALPEFERARIATVPLQVIWREIRPLRDLWGLFRLYRFLKREKFTLVHTHTSKAGFVGRLAARWAGVPAVMHTVHGFSFHERSRGLAARIYIFLERVAAHFCDRIVTVSNSHRDFALQLGIGDENKVLAIPNGIDPGRVKSTRGRSLVRRDRDVDENSLVILAAGRLAPQKGFRYLIEAVPLLQQELNRPFEVWIAGDGPLHDELRVLAERLNVSRQVKLLGFRSDIGDLLGAADIVVLPSLWEGLSIALLEAMAAGKPVVTTRIASNVEVTHDGEAALLVPPEEPAALAAAVARLVRNPALAADLGSRARQLFLDEYCQDAMLRKYREQYIELTSLKSGKPSRDRAAARTGAQPREMGTKEVLR